MTSQQPNDSLNVKINTVGKVIGHTEVCIYIIAINDAPQADWVLAFLIILLLMANTSHHNSSNVIYLPFMVVGYGKVCKFIVI